MPGVILLPFKPFLVAGNAYEEYWNVEYLHVYAIFPSAPLKDRIQMVQKQWRLKQDAKTKANSNCTNVQTLQLFNEWILRTMLLLNQHRCRTPAHMLCCYKVVQRKTPLAITLLLCLAAQRLPPPPWFAPLPWTPRTPHPIPICSGC